MPGQKTAQKEIASYMGKILRDAFGKGPTSVHVTLTTPFFTIAIENLLAPLEQRLLDQDETQRITKTRDLLMIDLFPTIQPELERMMEGSIQEWYADWNLDTQTGMIWGVLADDDPPAFPWPFHLNQRLFEAKVNNMSIRGQKEPETITCFWLNQRTILIERTEIFVEIEKALIETGFTEELKIAKRPLERRLFREEHMEAILQQDIVDIFTDWYFETDKGYMVVVMKPRKK